MMTFSVKRKLGTDIATSDRHLLHYFQVQSRQTVLYEPFQQSDYGIGIIYETYELQPQIVIKSKSHSGEQKICGCKFVYKKSDFTLKTGSIKSESGYAMAKCIFWSVFMKLELCHRFLFSSAVSDRS